MRINEQTVVGITFYEDFPLSSLSRYYYTIAARDSSFNQGASSAVISAATNPPLMPGWPIETTQSTTAGVKIADLDAIDDAIQQCSFGKLTPEALYVHADYIGELPALLRVYQGAARIVKEFLALWQDK